jgi:uncharacterized membrane protein HdeD (DUF308 family)
VALTEYERRQLQQLAEQLLKDDPRLAAKLEGDSVASPSSGQVTRGAFSLLVGLFVFGTAVGARIPVLFVLGLALIGSAVYLIFTGFRLARRNPGDHHEADD